MADRTLLDLVQGILGEMVSDEVNSISDTLEATSVANVIRQVYLEIVDEFGLPANKTLQALTGLGDVTKPTHMQIPQETSLVEWIKYDCRISVGANKNFRDIIFKDPLDFVTLCNNRASTDLINYQIVQWDANVPLVIGRRAGPTYWTSFDDDLIVFDSYNEDVDSTLQSSKSICSVETRPIFTVANNFVPDLPENLSNLLYIQALSRCMINFKDKVSPKIERQENRTRVRTQRNKWRQGRQQYLGPDYGRCVGTSPRNRHDRPR